MFNRETIPLPSSGISSKKAVDCCRNAKRALEINLRQILGGYLSVLLNNEVSSDAKYLALAPGVRWPGVTQGTSSSWQVVRVASRAVPPLVLGVIVLTGANFLTNTASQLAAIETATGVLRAIDFLTTVRTGAPDDCEACARKWLWDQSKRLLFDPKIGRKRGGVSHKRKKRTLLRVR